MDYQVEQNPKYGFFQIKPTPSPDDIARFYTEEFYSGDYKRFNDSALEVQVLDKAYFDACRDETVETLRELLPASLQTPSVLDIGCGWGQALLHFREHGFAPYGFDPAPEAVAFAQKKGLDVRVAGMDTMRVFDQEFDVVTLFNVLEHLADPEAVIRDIRQTVIRRGGVLVIDVPNEFSAFQLAAQQSHNLTQWWVAPPGHLNYFSGHTLRNLLNANGFDVKVLEASFPLEMFLLFGDQYVGNPALGRQCHEKRMAFETRLRQTGHKHALRAFNRSMAELNLGRQVKAFAVAV